MTVRTRVAPSPTGDPHVGTVYMALFNRAFAKSHGGQFILRVEDTDQARSSTASEEAIFDALHWTGLDWDEGPDVGGDFGPYRQSERLAIYRDHVDRLLESGAAFHCFCTPTRLDEVRRAQQARRETPRYDRHCLGLDATQVAMRLDQGEPHVVRLKVPDSGDCRFVDGLRGEIAIPWRQIDCQVLLKADGFPTYHLAVVVDDRLMQISHVLRGEEWISSFPKHRLLYDAFGWPMPEHYHLPLLRNPDKSKLSKRKNPTGVDYYRRAGYLPEALVNYLALMGYSMPDEREQFTMGEMTSAFEIRRVSTTGPVFDLAKLDWLNGQYIRALSPDAFMSRLVDWASHRGSLGTLVPLVQTRTERLIDVLPQVDFLLGERRPLSANDFAHKSLGAEDCQRILDHVYRRLEGVVDWRRDSLYAALKSLADDMGIKLRDLLAPVFVAISGRSVALPLFDSLAFLGRDLARARLRTALEALGGVSKGVR